MQVTLNQVVVQLSPSARVGGGAPVFSVSTAPATAGAVSQVQLSAAARAMAEVSSTGTRPQLALFVQLVGSLGAGAAQSFVASSPAAAAAERFQPPPADLGQQARAEAAEDAQRIDAALAESKAAALQAVSSDNPAAAAATAVTPAQAPAPVAAYRQAAAPATAPATPVINLSA